LPQVTSPTVLAMPMVGLVGPWMSRLIKGKTLFVPQWQATYA
jgi:hypothetical protein